MSIDKVILLGKIEDDKRTSNIFLKNNFFLKNCFNRLMDLTFIQNILFRPYWPLCVIFACFSAITFEACELSRLTSPSFQVTGQQADNLLAWVGVCRVSCRNVVWAHISIHFFLSDLFWPFNGRFFTCRAQYLQNRSSISEFMV